MSAPGHRSDWSLSTLHEYLLGIINANDRLYLEKFTAADRAVGAAITAADRATEKAERATEKRLEGVNELRGMAEDQQRLMMPRLEQEAVNKGTELKLAELVARVERASGSKTGEREMFAYFIAVASIVIAIVTYLHHAP